MNHVLLVEDDNKLAALISRELVSANYTVRPVGDGQAALEIFEKEKFDAVILDWMLPKMDGLQVLQKIRQTSFVPVLMLTARADEVDRVIGLEIGADDYLTKPFNMRELLARIRALLRRVEHTRKLVESDRKQEKAIEIQGLEIDPQSLLVKMDGDPVDLTSIEFQLLYILAANPGRTFTRRYLMLTVWDQEYLPGDRCVDNAILRLRKKLGAFGENIETLRGLGYRMAKW